MGQKTDSHHGKDHVPGGADPTYIGWNDPEVSADIGATNIIQFGDGLTVTDEGNGVIRVDAFPGLPFNVGELGYSGGSSLASTYTHTLQYQDVREGDAIFVMSMAPSTRALGSGSHYPQDCTDSLGNTYDDFFAFAFEAASPAVNEGVGVNYWCCTSSVGPMVAGTDTITVTWTGTVYDRSIGAFIVRHDGGSAGPSYIDQAGGNDAAIYADTKVTLPVPTVASLARNNGLLLGHIIAARPIGAVAFGAVTAYDGFYLARSRTFTGSKQTYVFNPETYGADSYVVANATITDPYEIDLGSLPAGAGITGFNGVGENFPAIGPAASGANTWKGITLWLAD